MIRDLPPLPLPQYTVVRIGCSADVPDEIANDLRQIGIPTGLIGYEYQPLGKAAFLDGIGLNGLVTFGTSGLFGRIGIDVASRRVAHIPTPESATANHVNRNLGLFHECVAATIARFPFYEEGEEESFQAADELRELIATLDDTALAHNGFWETLCDDVEIGDYANWREST
ncbi:SUKH-4 family immunity protein [Streptomyces sp. NBC_00140]|uniref:SUKH-4 family immunity protein n=1 Tax=Streptomyces sp. NBC_00140 TaxID=2975664 RepID=UPI00225C0EE5|nr:SUKH-4 family immunity protein [Streptomyces sp. NBC_00140]MCX5328302.1 SUKH-4 family immunity protein [Streptomyces sp. NBC_00140]